ncbi:MAG: DUF1697 domain-containing protein [Bacteroidales bacterium]|nr:DUF1697 domain-containing protein [Bacteroidales bacterium]
MADLKRLFVSLGFTNIKTYIQSGNVIFVRDGKEDCTEIAVKVEQEILRSYAFDLPVIVRAFDEFKRGTGWSD